MLNKSKRVESDMQRSGLELESADDSTLVVESIAVEPLGAQKSFPYMQARAHGNRI